MADDFSKLALALTGKASALVDAERLAPAVGSGSAPVFASPMLVALMEAAAVDCVEKLLPAGHSTLGVRLDVTHSAPTPAGLTVTATAELTTIEGRKLTFKLDAHDGIERIGSGTHTRVVVDTHRFLARVAAKSARGP